MAPSIEVVADKTERLFVWLPWAGSASAGYDKLRDLLQVERLVVDYDREARAFRVARSHLVTLAINMADEYSHVTVAQEFKQQAKCTTSCENANPNSLDQCSCVCEGTQHAGGGWLLERGGPRTPRRPEQHSSHCPNSRSWIRTRLASRSAELGTREHMSAVRTYVAGGRRYR